MTTEVFRWNLSPLAGKDEEIAHLRQRIRHLEARWRNAKQWERMPSRARNGGLFDAPKMPPFKSLGITQHLHRHLRPEPREGEG